MIKLTRVNPQESSFMTDAGDMTTRDDVLSPPLGARVLPGVDLALWLSLVMLFVLIGLAGAVAAWALLG